MKPFAVKVENEAVSEALQRAAFAAGYGWAIDGAKVKETDSPYLEFGSANPRLSSRPDGKTIYRNYYHRGKKELVSIPEAFRRLREQITPPKPKTKTVKLDQTLGCVDGTTVEERDAATLAALRAIAEAHNYLCDKQCFPTCKVDIETVTIPAGEGE